MLKIDRATGAVSLTPILSWHEAEFIAAYDTRGERFASALADRAGDRRLHLARTSCRSRGSSLDEERVQGDISAFDWRLNDLTGGRSNRTRIGELSHGQTRTGAESSIRDLDNHR